MTSWGTSHRRVANGRRLHATAERENVRQNLKARLSLRTVSGWPFVRRAAMSCRWVLALVFLLVPVASAQAQLELQLGVRAGYVFGRGWTVGPGISFGTKLTTGNPFSQNWPTILVGGVAASGDVSFEGSGNPSFRVYAGPELALFHTCPAIVAPISGGLVLAVGRDQPARLGGQGSLAVLVAALHPNPTYLAPAPSPTFLAGAAYRVASIAGAGPRHELDADIRILFLPGDHGGLGYCGGD
jgi:hypothetical protein